MYIYQKRAATCARSLALHVVIGLLFSTVAYGVIDGHTYLWGMRPEGSAKISLGSSEGSLVDINDDLGYGDEMIRGVQLFLGGTHQLGMEYVEMRVSAGNTMERNIVFNGITFPVQTDVTSSMDATFLKLLYRYEARLPLLRAGLITGIQYIDFYAEAEAKTVGATSADTWFILPLFGAYGAIDIIPMLECNGDIVISDWEYEGTKALFYDMNARIQWEPTPLIHAGLGYRYIYIDGNDDSSDISVDMNFSGPFIYAGLTW